MQKLIELEKDESILVSSQVGKFLKPDMIYIPFSNQEKILKQRGEHIKIGDEVVPGKFSSVSGVVCGIKKGESFKEGEYYLEIENDFEEERKSIGLKRKVTKEDILSFWPLKGKKNFVLNAIDDEVYVVTENFYLFLYYDVFFELLDDISKWMDLNIYVCLKASSSENIHQLMSDLGMYPNIVLKVVPDYYLLGENSFLISYLGLDEESSFVVSASSFYDGYNYLKRGRTKSDQLITISGNAIKNPMVVQVKTGSLLSDVVQELVDFKTSDVVYWAGGLMRGQKILLSSFVITDEFKSLLIMKKKKTKEEGKCIHCGLCSDICPVHLKPVYFHNPTYFKKVKNECIKCGLCSYICPVYISFHNYWEGENHE